MYSFGVPLINFRFWSGKVAFAEKGEPDVFNQLETGEK